MTALRLLLVGGCIAVVMAMSAVAGADEGIDTVDEDFEFGEHAGDDSDRLDDPKPPRGRVDDRSQYNPLAGSNIAWRSGYIAPRGTVTVANRLLYGQRLESSIFEGGQFFAEGYLPLGSQTYLGAGGQVRVASGEAWSVTAGVQGRYRRTNFHPGTADAGTVMHAVFDAIATDDTTWNVGLAVHMPVFQLVEDVDFDGCDNRREWAESTCGVTEQRTDWMPASGWWAALYGGLNHFVTDWLVLNVEAFTGISQGNFWALESALSPELAYDAERGLVEETDFSAGLGPLGAFTLGLGSTWIYQRAAIQPAVYLTTYGGDAQIMPWLSAAIRF